MARFYLYTDGGSRGNPGPSAIGGHCEAYNADREMEELFRFSECIEDTTNNVAEYKALIKGLHTLVAHAARGVGSITEVVCYLDSELVVKQMKGLYKVRQPALVALMDEAARYVRGLSKHGVAVEFQHIPRHMNGRADRLVNIALDMRGDRG